MNPLAFLTAGLLLLTGCYEHVVRTSNPAAYRGPIHESNLESSRVPWIDDTLDKLEGKAPPKTVVKPGSRPRPQGSKSSGNGGASPAGREGDGT